MTKMELDKILHTLKDHMRFKPVTEPDDIVLVGMPSGLFYGVVQSMERNIKKDWYNLSFKLLVIPPADITWILRVPQMSGELFTINGENHFVIAVDTGRIGQTTEDTKPKVEQPKSKGRRLSLVKQDFEDS